MSVQVRPVAPVEVNMFTKMSNNVYVFDLNLDTSVMRDSAMKMYDFVVNYYGADLAADYFSKSTPISTKLYKNYNLLLYPFPGFHELYWNIQQAFHASITDLMGATNRQYYITSWINVYHKGQYIDWHSHAPPNHFLPEEKYKMVWHGFYCVDTEPSSTIYKSLETQEEIVIDSINNRLVLGPAEGNVHKTSDWLDDSKPRITIAFDILSSLFIRESERYFEYSNIENLKQKNISKTLVNRWIPI